MSSEYIKFSEESGSKSVHRTEILYNFSKIAQEKIAQMNKESQSDKSFSDHNSTPNLKKSLRKQQNSELSQVKKVSTLLSRLRKSKKPLKKYESTNSARQKQDIEMSSNIKSIESQSPVLLDSHRSVGLSKQSSFRSDKS